jgi:hypothetical protein
MLHLNRRIGEPMRLQLISKGKSWCQSNISDYSEFAGHPDAHGVEMTQALRRLRIT